jgi:hypothetical protein
VWENVLLPWFKHVAIASLESREPVAVITPSRGHADFFRRQLLAHRISLIGVKFFTPPQLRELLLLESTLRLPLREHLRLLLAISADEVRTGMATAGNPSPEMPIAKSVARDPDNFLRAFDQLRAAGCQLQEIKPAVLRQIAASFEKRVCDCGFTLVHEADRLLDETTGKSEPLFGNLLVAGFDGAHWPLWPLLHASVQRSRQATVVLSDPRDEARDIDQAWIGTWEQQYDAAEPIASLPNEAVQFAELTEPLESPSAVAKRRAGPLKKVHFLIGRDSSEQARVIAALVVSFLNESSCKTVAILFAGPGALARLVAQALDTLGVPHNDSVAHPLRGAFDNEEWRAWLKLQERPEIASLLQFLNHSPAAVAFFPNLALPNIEKVLRRGRGDILINDVEVLTEYWSRRTEEKFSGIVSGLRAIRFLPEEAAFSDFLKTTLSIFHGLGWRERAAELERLTRDWSTALRGTFSRQHFLRWLTELFVESALCRDPQGDHPYARVQLLRYDQAENQTWSHLILTGLNEGVWPNRDDESPFLPDEQIVALNAQMRAINKRATKESRFGAGQTTVREGMTLCLAAQDRRDIALRQLLNAIESTTGEIGVTAQLYNTSPREQAVNPSEFFARLHFNARGTALSQREINGIHARTRKWLDGADPCRGGKADNNANLQQTRLAYLARRRGDQSFGEYEFAFRKGLPPAGKISLSATDTAKLFATPALVWMKTFLGVESMEHDGISWNLATGQWVHQWLAAVGRESSKNSFAAKPSADEIRKRVIDAAEHFREEMLATLSAAGKRGRLGRERRTMPDWWLSGWRNARYVAERFAEELGRVSDWPRLATEWVLDSPQIIPLDEGEELHVRGRVDLLLADADDPPAGRLWIVDYKTGMAAALKPQRAALRKELVKGNGVQICIYALALQTLGWRDIGVSLLARETELDHAQIDLSHITGQNDIWKEIARMENTGIFGMLGELRSEFTFTGDYPLATLAIDKDLLRDKWRRTHPPFAGEESDE